MFKIYDKVTTLVDKEKFKKGHVGIIVDLYNNGPACEAELWDDNENPIDVVTYLLCEIKKVL